MRLLRKKGLVILVGIFAVLGTSGPSVASGALAEAPEPVQIDQSFAVAPLTDCPWITDSIVRLYSAYFGRRPDATGFAYWLALYQDGVGLEEISENFVLSAEFRNTYGTTTNEQFVFLVYQNVLGRNPNPSGLAYWTGLLNSRSISYGATMLSFSESTEYVVKSKTTRPAAGYFLWFAEGTEFHCGIGSANVRVPFETGSLGYIMLPPADDSAQWGHEFDVLAPDGVTLFKNNPYDPSIPATATVLTADFENLEGYYLSLRVEPNIRWSLNIARGGQPDNLDTWLGDPSVPRS